MSGEDEQVLTQRKPEEAEVEPEEKKVEEAAAPETEAPADAPAGESRVARFLRGASENMPEGVKNAMHALAPVADAIHRGFVFIWPYLVAGYIKGKAVYDQMPEYSVVMIYGLIVAFCGAHFAAIVAVVEAFKQTGAFKKIAGCLVELYESFKKLHAENAKDNAKDEDGDGVSDVDELSNGELFLRKCGLVMRTVDPNKFNKALNGLYTGFLAAVMVVKFEFAKTVTLGASLGDFMEKSVDILLDPLLEQILPKEYMAWVDLIEKYVCRSIGVAIAWSIQFYNSLLHCAVAGSLIFSRALVPFLNQRDIIHVENLEDTYLDEIIGWALAVVSIFIQAAFGFKLLFPFNVVLSPLLGVEWTLRLCASDDTFGGNSTM